MRAANLFIDDKIVSTANLNKFRNVKVLPSSYQDVNKYINELLAAIEVTNLIQATD